MLPPCAVVLQGNVIIGSRDDTNDSSNLVHRQPWGSIRPLGTEPSHDATMRSEKETADVVNAAAAVGVLQLLFRWDGARHSEQVSWLREIEPGFSQMDADRAVMLMRRAVEWG